MQTSAEREREREREREIVWFMAGREMRGKEERRDERNNKERRKRLTSGRERTSRKSIPRSIQTSTFFSLSLVWCVDAGHCVLLLLASAPVHGVASQQDHLSTCEEREREGHDHSSFLYSILVLAPGSSYFSLFSYDYLFPARLSDRQ